MITFGLITEGTTDQAVIENVLKGFFNNSEHLYINPLSPPGDETDRQHTHNYSNWCKVFQFCESDEFEQALLWHDYLIIQIDTDVSQELGYDVSHEKNGFKLEPIELIFQVKQRIIRSITGNIFSIYQDKIIFAICVHSIECWLLPIYCSDLYRNKINNCLFVLNKGLEKNNKDIIEKDNKTAKYYKKLSSNYLKNKILTNLCATNPSLNIFVEELRGKNIDCSINLFPNDP